MTDAPQTAPEPGDDQSTDGAFVPRHPPVENLGFQLKPNPSIPERESRVASTLAYVLAGLLAFAIVLQYAALGVLVYRNRMDAIPTFEHLFNAVLPVLAGLAGSAVAYYLTKEKK